MQLFLGGDRVFIPRSFPTEIDELLRPDGGDNMQVHITWALKAAELHCPIEVSMSLD